MKNMRGLQFLPENSTYDLLETPVGQLTIITSEHGLHAILWGNDHDNVMREKALDKLQHAPSEKTILKTKKQLAEYFQGKRKIFDIPLVLNGTDFQVKAWQQLLKIPYGETISYAKQAEKIGNKNKARPIGMANNANPIPIVVPCHRVIGSDGKLVGFGGGMENKVLLLQLENNLFKARENSI